MQEQKPTLSSRDHIQLTEQFGAHNYAPLDVVVAAGEGCWVTDVEGRRYLDMLSAYSALNFGHRNARIERVAIEQLKTLTLTSRAFYNDQFGLLCRDLASLCGLEMALLMNSGAEAVETAIKAARRWGYENKGVPAERAEIICFNNNFHGRTTTIVGFSTSEESRHHFGPFTPGFRLAPFGDLEAVAQLINEHTVAVLIEPIQGEGGILIPPTGYLRELRELCRERKVLFIADEIQTGLCRTGEVFACTHEQVQPDAYILGKSLGGGVVPISALIGTRELMEVFTPGSHGSTFGGNPFACAIAREVLAIIADEQPHERARELGDWFGEELRSMKSPHVLGVRQRGLMIGVDIAPAYGKAKEVCKELKAQGVLCKDTREQTIRFAPPLTITRDELAWALERIRTVLAR